VQEANQILADSTLDINITTANSLDEAAEKAVQASK
jgi:succinyl-CoA synthetase beta subunit